MKKIISRILIMLLIFLNLDHISIVRAASTFDLFYKELKNEKNGFSNEGAEDKSCQLVEYEQGGTGKYTFKYYIEDKEEIPWEIQLDFNKESDDRTMVQISATDKDNQKNEKFLVRKLESNGWSNQVNFTTEPDGSGVEGMGEVEDKKFKKVLDSNKKKDSLGLNDTHMYIELGDIAVDTGNLVIKMKKNGNKISFSTNGLKRGLVTCFGLSEGKNEVIKYVFPGVNGLSILPQHFVKDGTGVKNLRTIDTTSTGEMMGPGERPGVVVSYDKIKKINIEGSEFEFKDSKESYTYKLWIDNGNIILEYKENSSNTKISYSTKDGENGIIENALVENGNKIEIKLASQDVIDRLEEEFKGVSNVKIKDMIVPWKELSGSKLLQRVDMTVTMDSNKQSITEENIDMDKYTYLKYQLGKDINEHVFIKLNPPYQTENTVEYYVFTSGSENELLTKEEDSKSNGLSFEKESGQSAKPYSKKVVAASNSEDIKIEVETADKTYVRIVGVVDGTKYCYSQILQVNLQEISQEPEVPTGLNVSNIVVTPSKNNSEVPSSVKANLSWNAPIGLEDTYLQKGELYYELILRDSSDSEQANVTPGTSEKAAYVKVYKAYIDDNKNVKLKPIQSSDREGNEVNGVFQINDVYFKREGLSEDWVQLVTSTEDSGLAKKEAIEHWQNPTTDFYKKMKEEASLIDKRTGKVYYLSIRAVYLPKENSKKMLASNESALVALPIDFTENIIPVPDTVVYKKEDERINEKGNVDGGIGFNHVDIKEYVDTMLEPAGLELSEDTNKKYSGKYEFYLYKKDTVFNKDNATDITNKLEDKHKVDLELALNGESNSTLNNLLESGILKWEYSIDQLHMDKEKPKDELDEFINFYNLMSNQAYMIKVRVKLEPKAAGKEQDPRYSEFSKEFTFTTTTQANPPGTDERKPPIPSEIRIEPVEGSNNSARVIWDKVNFVKDNDMEVYYELVRSTKDLRKELTAEQFKQSIEKIISGQSRSAGFATIDVNGALDQVAKYMTYQNGTWSVLKPESNVPIYTYDRIMGENEVEEYSFIDNQLAPNNVYYYYVRTVCIIKDGLSHTKIDEYQKVKSDWISANITTAAVKAPENLKIETGTKYNEDSKHNVVISFEAEIPITAKIPEEFDFEIVIKTDEEADYKLVQSKIGPLEKVESGRVGWTKFIYKIQNLKSNMRYNIKVRVVDKTTKIEDTAGLEESEIYAKSFYSSILVVRTDFDEEDQKDQEAYEEYVKKLQWEIDKIKSSPYWRLENNDEYKYRLEYVKSDFQYNGTYTLANEDNDKSTLYYLPVEIIQLANENNITLEIKLGAVSVSIRPSTLLEDQKEIRDAMNEISTRSIQDYYIIISASTREVDMEINGEKNISPEMCFEMSLAYMKKKDKEIEVSILKELDTIYESEKKEFISKIERELKRDKLDEAFLESLVTEASDHIKASLSKKISRIIDREDRNRYIISSVNKSILFTYETDDVMGNAYYNNGNWINVPCYANGSQVFVEIQSWGKYIMTGMKDLLDSVPTLAPYQSFISTYGLTEIFELDNYMINTAVTKQQMYGALAKVLGAPAHTDYLTYLKSKGIKGISSLTAAKTIRQDEAIYLVMQGYEQIHHINVKEINITNKQSVKNIGAFQPVYRDYVYAAVKLNIVVPNENQVYPSNQISVEMAIKMLYGMQK